MAIALSVAFTNAPLAAGNKLLIECTPQLPAGRNFVGRSQYRQIQVTAAAAVSPVDILSTYTARFGPLVSGRKIFIRLTVLAADGQRSAPLTSSIIVT